MKYTPIIVLVILALGITAVTLYRPHRAVRLNAIGLNGGPGGGFDVQLAGATQLHRRDPRDGLK
jgi:hypothetical protein